MASAYRQSRRTDEHYQQQHRPRGRTSFVDKPKKSRRTLTFRTSLCAGCGSTRVLGQPCADCGRKSPAGEVNAPIVTRRTAVREIQEALDDRSHGPRNQTSSRGFPSKTEINEYLSNFINALDGLLEPHIRATAIDRMVAVEKSFARLASECSDYPSLRPTIAKQRAVTRSLTTLTRLWPTYSEALTAGTMEEAKQLSNDGQQLIDAAEEAISEYEALEETTSAYEDLSNPDLLDRTLNALSISHQEHSLLELGQLGAQEAESASGVSTGGGHGVQYLVLDLLANIHLDIDRFRALIRETSHVCEDDVRLNEVASEPGALEGLAESSRLLYESLSSFEAVILREQDEQALMRRVIKFYAEVYEDLAGPLFAWYSLITRIKDQPYEKLIQNDVTSLARSLTRNERTKERNPISSMTALIYDTRLNTAIASLSKATK